MELVNDFSVSVPIDEAWKTLTDLERIAPCMPGAQLQEIEGDQYRGVVKIKVGPILAQFKGQASFVERDAEAHRAVLKAEGRDTGGKGNANAVITAQLTPEGDGTKVSVSTDLTITGKVAQFGRGALADVSEKILRQFVQQLEATVLHPGDTSSNGGPAAGSSRGNGAPETVAAAPTAATGAAAESALGAPTAADIPSADAAQPPVEDETLSSPAVAGGPAASTPSATANSGPATPSAPSTPSSPAAAASPGEGTTARRVINQQEAEPIDLLQTAGVPIFKRLIPPLVIVAIVIVVVRWRRRS
jgi:carbon monoxide dehydrogenase subunit G